MVFIMKPTMILILLSVFIIMPGCSEKEETVVTTKKDYEVTLGPIILPLLERSFTDTDGTLYDVLYGEEFPKENQLDYFVSRFNKIAGAKGKKLSDYFPGSTDEEVVDSLKRAVNESMKKNAATLRYRLGMYYKNYNVKADGGRIIVECRDVPDSAFFRGVLTMIGDLTLNKVIDGPELIDKFYIIDSLMAASIEVGEKDYQMFKPKYDSMKSYKLDYDEQYNYMKGHPFTSMFITQRTDSASQKNTFMYVPENRHINGMYDFWADEDLLNEVVKLLHKPQLKDILGRDYTLRKNVSFYPSVNSLGDTSKYFFFYIVESKPLLTSASIKESTPTVDEENNLPLVLFKFNEAASKKWEKITEENIGRRIAIIYNGLVMSAPVVISKITGGSCQITGFDTFTEAKELSSILKSGTLAIPLEIKRFANI